MADVGGIAGDQLRSLVERYERLQEEIDALNDDKSALMTEVASQGFDKKIFKVVIARRKMGKVQAAEQDDMVELYERALEGKPDPQKAALDAAEGALARARAGGRARGYEAVQAAVAKFMDDVPADTTVSIATQAGKGFAVTNADGKTTVRQFGQEAEAAVAP